MPEIDIDRCVRACFAWCDTMTPEQRELAESLIDDGPPNRSDGSVILKLPPGAVWDSTMNTITRGDAIVQLRTPMNWTGHGSAPVALTVPT